MDKDPYSPGAERQPIYMQSIHINKSANAAILEWEDHDYHSLDSEEGTTQVREQELEW